MGILRRAVLCCAVLCFAVLWCVLRCAVCCAVLVLRELRLGYGLVFGLEGLRGGGAQVCAVCWFEGRIGGGERGLVRVVGWFPGRMGGGRGGWIGLWACCRAGWAEGRKVGILH